MEDKSLDHIIRNKLQSLRPDLPADAWEQFEQAVGAPEFPDQITPDKPLDHIVRNKLESLHPDLPTDAWEQFEQAMDTVDSGVPELDASLIDEVAFAKMRGLDVNQPAPNWSALRRQMDAHVLLTQRLASYKIVEAALLSLILLLFIRLGNPLSPTTTPTESEPVTPMASSRSSLSEGSPATDSQVSPNGTTTTEAGPTGNKVDIADETATLSLLPLRREENGLSSGTSLNKGLMPVLPLGTPKAETTWSMTGILPGKNAPDLTFGPLAFQQPAIKTPSSPATLVIGAFGGAAYNRVITPPDGDLGIVGYDRYTLGYGGGLSLGLDFGRMEVGSGIGYTAVRYDPLPILVTRGSLDQGYTAEKFDFVELDVISLPIYVRYNAIMDKGWKAYATAGASLQVAYETNFYGVFPEGLGLPEGLIRPRRGESSFNNRYGWLEGGGFWENSYVTLNLGIGVERVISENLGIFVQPTYSHNLGYFSEGMGPTHDRLHTMSVLTGVRLRLRK